MSNFIKLDDDVEELPVMVEDQLERTREQLFEMREAAYKRQKLSHELF